ncbi:unknown [Clostridium sp. CAG:440]|nr:unknown [Clostridium sp. CAG:440]
MITLQDVKNNPEVEALILGAQQQLDGLRLHRTQP